MPAREDLSEFLTTSAGLRRADLIIRRSSAFKRLRGEGQNNSYATARRFCLTRALDDDLRPFPSEPRFTFSD